MLYFFISFIFSFLLQHILPLQRQRSISVSLILKVVNAAPADFAVLHIDMQTPNCWNPSITERKAADGKEFDETDKCKCLTKTLQ